MLRRFFKILFYSCIAGILTGTILLIACVIAIDKKWSPLIESRVRERQSIGSVKVLASNEDGKGVWIGSLTSGRYEERQALTLAEMPPLLAQSVVVLEDPRFLIHGGFDIWGILRAAVVNLKSLRISQGGSTITQQLVKNIFLSREKRMTRKFTELVIAALV